MTPSGRIRISLVVPPSEVRRTGNRCTTWQWASILESLGHEVVIEENAFEPDTDLLIALHAGRSHDSICRFREARPAGYLVVALTGSDIYPEPDDSVRDSIRLADRLVVLQDQALEKIPPQDREKAQVIIQSATALGRPRPDPSHLDVCVVGHLRDVKDPMRAAEASHQLPESSAIRILHAGGIHEAGYHQRVDREMAENPRYRWLGELDEQAVANLIASSRVMVMSSKFEGGARVVGEAVVHGTPVIASRIDGVVGLLGDDYPAYFEVGDTGALVALLNRFETDADFAGELRRLAGEFAPRFDPRREREAWRQLIDSLIVDKEN